MNRITTISKDELPPALGKQPDAPAGLYVMAQEGFWQRLAAQPKVAVVGTRRPTAYGKQITEKLVGELVSNGVTIISGLAYGIDITAHRAALAAGGTTVAVLPGPVDYVVPRTHANDARRIVDSGGALISEYASGTPTYRYNFVERNRIVSGLADVLLVVEATEDSGTKHTVDFALDQGIDIMAVPGPINSPASIGTNNMLKSNAGLVTGVQDVLHALRLPDHQLSLGRKTPKAANKGEQLIIDLLEQGVTAGQQLRQQSGLRIEQYGHHMTMLEITARIRPLGADNWSLA